MKQGIHPDYREVVFSDEDAGFAFLTRSTIKTNETIQWEDGNRWFRNFIRPLPVSHNS